MIECPHTGRVLDIDSAGNGAAGTKVIMWDKHYGPNQLWFEDADNHITNPATGMCMDINGGSRNDSAPIIIWTKHSNWNQKFVFKPDGSIECPETGKVFDISGGSQGNGGKIIMYGKHGNWN
jgi:hypothetical protein